jgi:hypothetical protein
MIHNGRVCLDEFRGQFSQRCLNYLRDQRLSNGCVSLY